MNYFSNALNHCAGEKVIEIKIVRENKKARICVFNTGEPIPEDCIEHVWEKFYKVDKARTREYGGSGVGLSIVKAIMDSMNQKYGGVIIRGKRNAGKTKRKSTVSRCGYR